MSPVVPNSGKKKNGDIKKTVPASSSDVNQIKFNQYIDTVSIKKDHICNSLENRIEKNSAVLLHFTLTLEDGSIAESSRLSGKPALFCLGDQSLSDMLEAQLLGLKVNDKKNLHSPQLPLLVKKILI